MTPVAATKAWTGLDLSPLHVISNTVISRIVSAMVAEFASEASPYTRYDSESLNPNS